MPRISKKFGYVPDLPNQGSPLQTPSTLLIDVHYSKLMLVERWTWERFTRLCAFLRISPAELASSVLMPHSYLEAYERSNRIHRNRTVSLALALHLTCLELRCCGEMTNDVVRQPFPNLNKPDAQPTSPS